VADAPDLDALWLPFTANRAFRESPRLVAGGSGLHLTAADGRVLLDAVSGLFCSPAGHGRPEIADAVHKQLLELSYCTTFQHGHPRAFELARRLAALLPGDLDHLFFASSGSEAVDTALKIALAYHRARGEGQRVRLVGRERAYHGVNFGGTSVGGIAANRAAFGPGLPGTLHLRHTWLPENRFARDEPPLGLELADDLERLCRVHGGDTIAACIVEPVAGSTGCLVPPRGYLARLREICDAHGILLVFDEVITGFGRLGAPFAAERFGVQPDLVTLAKALTNGAVPMSAVAVRRGIRRAILDAAPEGAIELFHGYTWSAHPGACAAALAALDLYEREDLFARAVALAPIFQDAVFSLRDLPVVTDVRGLGCLAGFDLAPEGEPGARGQRAVRDFFEAGIFVKVTGDAVLLAPAFVAEPRHLDEMVERLRGVLRRY
jgi:beta-alanine--pyruvate transaminase